jgi:hypothetical protein
MNNKKEARDRALPFMTWQEETTMNGPSKVLVKTGKSTAPTSWHPFEASQQAIRERAYFIWEREGRPPGRAIANWLEAEAEINYNDVDGFVRSWADVVAVGYRTQDQLRALAALDY